MEPANLVLDAAPIKLVNASLMKSEVVLLDPAANNLDQCLADSFTSITVSVPLF